MNAEGRERLVRDTIDEEWRQFQATTNEGGRAACQNNRPMFTLMRASQFAPWPDALVRDWLDDLRAADAEGRNLVTEKYARMMASTDPETYRRDLEPFLPALDGERVALQERVIATQVAWARDFRERYPHLGDQMRVLTTDEDTPEATSFETYLRGELGTYSARTMRDYADFVDGLAREGRNLTAETVGATMRALGHDTLEEAERAQALQE